MALTLADFDPVACSCRFDVSASQYRSLNRHRIILEVTGDGRAFISQFPFRGHGRDRRAVHAMGDRDGDGHQHGEGAPGAAHGEGDQRPHHEEQRRQQVGEGHFATLDDVLRFYSTLEGQVPSGHHAETILVALALSETEMADLRAFLEALTDESLDPALLSPP